MFIPLTSLVLEEIHMKNLTLYTNGNGDCAGCNTIHAFLKEHDIRVATVDVYEDPSKMPRGIRKIPALVDDLENKVVIGDMQIMKHIRVAAER